MCFHNSPLKEQLLRDTESPLGVKLAWKEDLGLSAVLFQVRVRTSGILRIHHALEGGMPSFQSIICTAGMTTRDVIQLSLAKVDTSSKSGDLDDFELLLRTQDGG